MELGHIRKYRSGVKAVEKARIRLTQRLRPPSGRHTRSVSGVSPKRNSVSPPPIVPRAMPVVRVTALPPPRPQSDSAAARAAARPQSHTGASASKRWRMANSSITLKR